MKLPRRVIDAYNRAIKQCGDNAEAATRKALDAWLEGHPGASIAQIREVAIAIMDEFGTVYGKMAGDAAYAMREIAADAAGVEVEDVAYDYAPDPEYVRKTAKYQVGKLIEGDSAAFVGQVADASRYFAERGANDTMAHFAKVDKGGARFARVPTGSTTCPYCLMLASRGFVYKSEAKALNGNHRHCDCRIIEGFEGMEVEGYDPDLYYDMWKHPENFTDNTQGVLYSSTDMNYEKVDAMRVPAPESYWKKKQSEAEALGGQFQIADDSWLKHFRENNAWASTIGDTAILREDATRSELAEETIHIRQNIAKLNDDLITSERIAINEYLAHVELLEIAEKEGFTREEIDLILYNKDRYYSDIRKMGLTYRVKDN